VVKGYSPVFVRKLREAVWTKGGRITKKYSLLTDWINTGEEISSLILHLRNQKCEVDKVYCYAVCEDTIAMLTSGPLKKVPIVAGNKIKPGDPTFFSRKLQAYYQCLLDPIDIDNAYDIYQIGGKTTPNEIKEVVQLSCQKVLGSSAKFEFGDHHFLPANMESMHLDLEDLCSISDASLKAKIDYLLTKIEFDYPHITLKTVSGKGGLRFSLDCCFPTTPLHRNSLKPEKGCNICQPTQCYIKLNKSKMPMKKRWKMLCPLCIENYVERSVLDKINEVIVPILSEKGGLTVQKNNPIQRVI
jgi:hypothetical protein